MVPLVGIVAAVASGAKRRDHHVSSVVNNSLIAIPRKLIYPTGPDQIAPFRAYPRRFRRRLDATCKQTPSRGAAASRHGRPRRVVRRHGWPIVLVVDTNVRNATPTLPQRCFWSCPISPAISAMTRTRRFSCASTLSGKSARATQISAVFHFSKSSIRCGRGTLGG